MAGGNPLVGLTWTERAEYMAALAAIQRERGNERDAAFSAHSASTFRHMAGGEG